jgi:hypothetical protein
VAFRAQHFLKDDYESESESSTTTEAAAAAAAAAAANSDQTNWVDKLRAVHSELRNVMYC